MSVWPPRQCRSAPLSRSHTRIARSPQPATSAPARPMSKLIVCAHRMSAPPSIRRGAQLLPLLPRPPRPPPALIPPAATAACERGRPPPDPNPPAAAAAASQSMTQGASWEHVARSPPETWMPDTALPSAAPPREHTWPVPSTTTRRMPSCKREGGGEKIRQESRGRGSGRRGGRILGAVSIAPSLRKFPHFCTRAFSSHAPSQQLVPLPASCRCVATPQPAARGPFGCEVARVAAKVVDAACLHVAAVAAAA
eukprot:272466-Chlamydomonas_euryale.AAC.1